MPGDQDLKAMIGDYMEQGFLENILDMFRHDPGLYPLIGALMADERVRVRLGVSALVETLSQENPGALTAAIPGIAALLENHSPTLRGDAAWLLGMIRSSESLPFLEKALADENRDVREIARESMEEIRMSTKGGGADGG